MTEFELAIDETEGLYRFLMALFESGVTFDGVKLEFRDETIFDVTLQGLKYFD
jgi:hypothetical protein